MLGDEAMDSSLNICCVKPPIIEKYICRSPDTLCGLTLASAAIRFPVMLCETPFGVIRRAK